MYCCGKFSSLSVSLNLTGKEKQDKNDGCCKTKYHVSKVKDNHIVADTVKYTAKQFVHPSINFSSFNIVALANPQLNATNGIHDPPILHGNTPIYIFIHLLRV